MSILNFLERFCAFDYKDRNQEIYGQDTPPDYDLAKVTAPVALYWGDNDWLAQQTVSNLGTIQVLRHHVYDFFRPIHLFDDLQYSKIAIF